MHVESGCALSQVSCSDHLAEFVNTFDQARFSASSKLGTRCVSAESRCGFMHCCNRLELALWPAEFHFRCCCICPTSNAVSKPGIPCTGLMVNDSGIRVVQVSDSLRPDSPKPKPKTLSAAQTNLLEMGHQKLRQLSLVVPGLGVHVLYVRPRIATDPFRSHKKVNHGRPSAINMVSSEGLSLILRPHATNKSFGKHEPCWLCQQLRLTFASSAWSAI